MVADQQTAMPNTPPLAPGATEPKPFYIHPSRIEVLKASTVGAFAGLITPPLGALLGTYVVGPILCRGETATAFCAAPQAVGYNTAVVLVGIAAVVVLAKLGVYRALLLAVASTIATWSLRKYAIDLAETSLLEFTAFAVVLFALVYGLFYWILRIRNFALSLVLVIVTLVAVGWALAS